jgi:hypothetical protein
MTEDERHDNRVSATIMIVMIVVLLALGLFGG